MPEPHTTYRQQGYLVFPDILSSEELATLRSACDSLLAEKLDDGGHSGKHKIGLGANRRFLAHRHEDFPDLEAFLLGPTIAKITQTCLGTPGVLFNEQFVVKGAKTGASFAWHQDSAYVGFDHDPYVTIWLALDDATLDNGCVYLLPRDLDKNPEIDPHEWLDDSNELNGYSGDATGQPMTCKAGSAVAFSSVTLHRSSTNTTDHARRAFIGQYSAAPIIDPKTGAPKRYAKPVKT